MPTIRGRALETVASGLRDGRAIGWPIRIAAPSAITILRPDIAARSCWRGVTESAPTAGSSITAAAQARRIGGSHLISRLNVPQRLAGHAGLRRVSESSPTST
ncbi:MAG: hypothetical protein DMG58_29200 [Acidobacteria bacterium]|nr:MAG: hypothetical protein DMG58_29200 [Acidobacteriota bacterium]